MIANFYDEEDAGFYDTSGKLIKTQALPSTFVTISLPELKTGLYVYRIFRNNERIFVNIKIFWL